MTNQEMIDNIREIVKEVTEDENSYGDEFSQAIYDIEEILNSSENNS